MRIFTISVCVVTLAHAWRALASPAPQAEVASSGVRGIDQATYDNLERYTKFSSAAYQLLGCPRPVGTTLVKYIDTKGTQGFVARDDSRKEIIVSFRGSLSPTDWVVNLQVLMTPLRTLGITAADAGDSYVHTGFHYAYNVVASEVIASVRSQLAAKPGYTVTVTGHSLGGAVGAIAALSIKSTFPGVPLKLYTFGAPRVGNAAFAQFAESRIGATNVFRAVHTNDGVPTILLKITGYRHFGTEYWTFKNPASPINTRKCNGAEDPTCSDSIPSSFINPSHLTYFKQVMALNPLLCLF